METRVDTAVNILETTGVTVPLVCLGCFFFKVGKEMFVFLLASTLGASVLDMLWGIVAGVPNNVLNVYYVEHYHWGLLNLGLASFFPPLWGSGLYLLLSDIFQEDPYSWGEWEHYNFIGTTLVGIGLTLLDLWLYISF